ncbi:MAG TPA: NUDIX domain-containing protein [Thermoleophilaceae bacterium]|nr:NUDIX domain-containing protein [Thermoleophilaceae bacterium]
MRVDRPPPGEELNPGEVSEARPAASLILLRDGSEGLEVLLVERNPQQRFMGGAWVFPGGARHAEDADHAATARRELREEAGVDLPGDAELVPFSRWITPAEVKVRFDTWFFATQAPAGTEAEPDGSECVAARWLGPAQALAAHERNELMLVFPTIKHLEQLAEASSVAETLAAARRRPVVAILPKVVVRDGAAEVLLPGEAGYEDA